MSFGEIRVKTCFVDKNIKTELECYTILEFDIRIKNIKSYSILPKLYLVPIGKNGLLTKN